VTNILSYDMTFTADVKTEAIHASETLMTACDVTEYGKPQDSIRNGDSNRRKHLRSEKYEGSGPLRITGSVHVNTDLI
jgi:hypothetical protein